MNGEMKISSTHRDRLAVIYLRQSSMAQVREHTESTTRQYGLAEVAVSLGWARQDVVVIEVEAADTGWGEGLSAPAAQAVPQVLAAIYKHVRRL